VVWERLDFIILYSLFYRGLFVLSDPFTVSFPLQYNNLTQQNQAEYMSSAAPLRYHKLKWDPHLLETCLRQTD